MFYLAAQADIGELQANTKYLGIREKLFTDTLQAARVLAHDDSSRALQTKM